MELLSSLETGFASSNLQHHPSSRGSRVITFENSYIGVHRDACLEVSLSRVGGAFENIPSGETKTPRSVGDNEQDVCLLKHHHVRWSTHSYDYLGVKATSEAKAFYETEDLKVR